MSTIKRILLFSLSTAVTISIFAATAYAEQIQGSLKSLAGEAKVFTITSQQGDILFINYNKATHWINLNRPEELETDDFLTIEVTRNKEMKTADTVTKSIAIPPPGFTSITTDKLAGILDRFDKTPPFTLIDLRPLELFDVAHLPGAVSIPFSRLEKRSPGLLPENKADPLIFYDQGAGGTEAARSAQLAKSAGFSNISVYPDGIAGWLKSGRFAASSAAFIRKVKPVVIDLRDEDQVAIGHLEGAVNIPANKLPEMYGMFPMDKRVPVVLYGDNDQQALVAAKTIKVWGYRNVTIFRGGTTAWLENAEVLSVEPADKVIHSTGSTHSGQLSATDFDKALSSPTMIEIVDVRSSTDYNKGKFPVGKHIPLQELPLRHLELTKGNIQVIFGADEQRAEMAYDLLKQLGYRVTYLQGSVSFSENGEYQIK